MVKKNAAIIGFGGMGGWHAKCVYNSDVVSLAGVSDINPARCAAAEAEGYHVYASNDELIRDPNVDLVIIAVPNELHKPLAIQAMRAGKHVVSEKPVTLSSADLQEMIDVSHETGRIFTVNQNRRWDGEFLVMRDIYNSGDLGEVHHIESRCHGSRGIPGDWRQYPEHGGGMIFDWGIHLIDQIMGIAKGRTLKRVFCTCDHITNELVDDGFQLHMFFDNGMTALVEVGTSNFIQLPRFYMVGRDGSAMIPTWGAPAKVVWCHNYHEKEVVPVVTAAGITKTMAPRDEKSISEKEIPQPASDAHDFFRNVVRAIDGVEEQYVTHHQMMVDMRIIEAAFESDRTGMPVDVDLAF